MAVDSRQRHVGDGVGIDCSAFYRIDIPLFCGKLPYKAIWLQFCHHQYHAGACHYTDRISGRSELHLPFLVYLFPFVSVFLTRYLKKISPIIIPLMIFQPILPEKWVSGELMSRLWSSWWLFYGLATYLVIIISFNLPFLMEEYGLSSGRAGHLVFFVFSRYYGTGFCPE